MKITLFCLFWFFALSALAGGFRWPNVEYSSAKLYLMNITLDQSSDFDWHIYQDGVFATSKIGSGINLDEAFLDDFHKAMVRGVNELRIGLGKCYLPRHGIIYYNDKGEAVAAFTACFECNKISFWSSGKLEQADYETDKNDWQRAEKQIEKIESIFKKAGIPVFNNQKEYEHYLQDNVEYKNEGEINIQSEELNDLFLGPFTEKEVKSWLRKTSRPAQLREVKETKITAGGEEYQFKVLKANRGSSYFLFSSLHADAKLVEAEITHGSIILPNGMSVGMSVEDVQANLGAYDGLSNPEKIIVKSETAQLEYFFRNQSLIKIRVTLN